MYAYAGRNNIPHKALLLETLVYKSTIFSYTLGTIFA